MTLSSTSIKYLNDRGIASAYQDFFWDRSQQEASLECGKVMHCGGFAPRPEELALGSSIQLHPITPYVGNNGKPQKWVTPIGDTSGFTMFTPHDEQEIMVVTEGVVKAMSVYQLGYNAMSLNGVDNWSIPRDDKTQPRTIKLKLINHLPATVYLAFDMDWHTNNNVLRALKSFAEALILTGRIVKVMTWDPKLKGLDDYLATLDMDSRCIAMTQMTEDAPEFNQFLIDLEEAETAHMVEIPQEMEPSELFHSEMLKEFRHKLIIPSNQVDAKNPMGYMWNRAKFNFEPLNITQELKHRIAPFLSNLFQKQRKKVGGAWKEVIQKGFNKPQHINACLVRIKLVMATLAQDYSAVLDADPDLLRFNNGVYNFRKNELIQDTSYLSCSTGYSLSQDPTPNFNAWVASSFEGIDKNIILAVMRFLVDAKPRHEKLVHVYGPSGSGKGVFCRLMGRLLGHHHVSNSSLDGLTKPDKIMQALRNARLCIDSDHIGLLNDPTLIYRIVSNEPVDVRSLYSTISSADTRPRRILIASIEPLNIKASTGSDGGWIRRCFPLKTKCTVRVEGIEERIYDELGGIMSQVLAMPIETAIELMNEYESESVTRLDKAAESPLVTFFEAHVVKSPGTTQIRPAKLYEFYKIWSTFRGIKPMSLTTFNRRLMDKGLRPIVQGKFYLDVDWVDAALDRMASEMTTDAYDPTNYSND